MQKVIISFIVSFISLGALAQIQTGENIGVACHATLFGLNLTLEK